MDNKSTAHTPNEPEVLPFQSTAMGNTSDEIIDRKTLSKSAEIKKYGDPTASAGTEASTPTTSSQRSCPSCAEEAADDGLQLSLMNIAEDKLHSIVDQKGQAPKDPEDPGQAGQASDRNPSTV